MSANYNKYFSKGKKMFNPLELPDEEVIEKKTKDFLNNKIPSWMESIGLLVLILIAIPVILFTPESLFRVVGVFLIFPYLAYFTYAKTKCYVAKIYTVGILFFAVIMTIFTFGLFYIFSMSYILQSLPTLIIFLLTYLIMKHFIKINNRILYSIAFLSISTVLGLNTTLLDIPNIEKEEHISKKIVLKKNESVFIDKNDSFLCSFCTFCYPKYYGHEGNMKLFFKFPETNYSCTLGYLLGYSREKIPYSYNPSRVMIVKKESIQNRDYSLKVDIKENNISVASLSIKGKMPAFIDKNDQTTLFEKRFYFLLKNNLWHFVAFEFLRITDNDKDIKDFVHDVIDVPNSNEGFLQKLLSIFQMMPIFRGILW